MASLPDLIHQLIFWQAPWWADPTNHTREVAQHLNDAINPNWSKQDQAFSRMFWDSVDRDRIAAMPPQQLAHQVEALSNAGRPVPPNLQAAWDAYYRSQHQAAMPLPAPSPSSPPAVGTVATPGFNV